MSSAQPGPIRTFFRVIWNAVNFTNRIWYPLLRYLDLEERRPYQMRHTAATLWLASGEAPEWIARQLGHTSTEMLFRVNTRYLPNLTRQDGSAMERLLASHRHPEHGYRSCLGLLSLARRFSEARLEAACEVALSLGTCRYQHVKDILQNGRDKACVPVADKWQSPEHAHVRGAKYYQ